MEINGYRLILSSEKKVALAYVKKLTRDSSSQGVKKKFIKITTIDYDMQKKSSSLGKTETNYPFIWRFQQFSCLFCLMEKCHCRVDKINLKLHIKNVWLFSFIRLRIDLSAFWMMTVFNVHKSSLIYVDKVE